LLLSVPDLRDPSAHQNLNTFIGQVAGTNAFIAVVVGDGEALAYVCDGHSVAAWLRGQVSGTSLTLSGKGESLVGTLEGDTVSGTLTLSGPAFAFQAARVTEGHTGLFRGTLPLANGPGVVSVIKIDAAIRGVMNQKAIALYEAAQRNAVRELVRLLVTTLDLPISLSPI
jgi:hypothetical protein